MPIAHWHLIWYTEPRMVVATPLCDINEPIVVWTTWEDGSPDSEFPPPLLMCGACRDVAHAHIYRTVEQGSQRGSGDE